MVKNKDEPDFIQALQAMEEEMRKNRHLNIQQRVELFNQLASDILRRFKKAN